MGLLTATAINWTWDGKPDLSMSVNGVLAGLVAITAPCAFVTVKASLLIGMACRRAGRVRRQAARFAEDRRSGRRGAGPPVQRRVRDVVRRVVRRRQDHRCGDGQRPLQRRRHDAAHRADPGHRGRRHLHDGCVGHLLAASSSSPSACASARKRKSKVSTSASTVRRPTLDSRPSCRCVQTPKLPERALNSEPAALVAPPAHPNWRTT